MQRVADGRAGIRTGFGIVLVVGVTGVFLSRFAPARVVLIESARPVAAAAAILVACAGFGAIAIAAARSMFFLIARERAGSESLSLVDALLIGFAVLGTLTGIVAWVGIAMPVVIVVMTAVGVAGGALVIWRHRRESIQFDSATIGVLSVPVLLATFHALTPANSPDELVYKLAVPHAYRLFGRMLELPLNSNSYLTMADQMVSLVATTLSNGIAARLVHLGIFIAALCALGRMMPGAAWGRAALLAIVAWTPALMISAGWAWNDWSTLGLLVAAFDRYERWADHHAPGDAAVAFAALGAAASIKYTALPWAVAMALLLIVRDRRPQILTAAVTIGLSFGAFFYLRNAIWTGSPVAPLLLPNAPAVANYRTGARFEGWLNVLRGYQVFDPRLADESLGILLPAAAIAGLFALRSGERRLRDLAIVGAIQLPILISLAPDSRIMVNAFVPAAAAGAAVVAASARHAHAVLRAALLAIVAIALIAQCTLALTVLSSYEVVPYLTGQESAVAYLERSRAFMRPYAWASRFSPPSARFLLLGENRTLYLERQCFAAGNLDGPRVAAWLSRFASAERLRVELQRLHITHVLLHTPWYRVGGAAPDVIEKEHVLQVSPATDAVLRSFLRENGRVVYRDREYWIFELR